MLRGMSDQRGPAPGPEPLPEPGPGQRPVSVPAAAQALGISERAVRKRIHAGTLRARPFGRSFMVWLPDNAGPLAEPGPAPGPEPGPEPIEAAYRVAPAEIERAIERTGEKYVADFAGLYDRISTELGRVYEGQLTAKDQVIATQGETIAELRRRAEVAEAAVVRREDQGATQAAQDGPHVEEAPTVAQTPAPGVWGRLRRWWGDRP